MLKGFSTSMWNPTISAFFGVSNEIQTKKGLLFSILPQLFVLYQGPCTSTLL